MGPPMKYFCIKWGRHFLSPRDERLFNESLKWTKKPIKLDDSLKKNWEREPLDVRQCASSSSSSSSSSSIATSSIKIGPGGQWWWQWCSWQSGRIRHQRSSLWIPSSYIFSSNMLEKTKALNNYMIRTGWFEKTWDQSQRQNLAPAIYKRSKLALDIRLTIVEFFADNSRIDLC